MPNDQRTDKGVFYMSLGFLGKHPVSDRDVVIEALKAQDKLKDEDQTVNKTNETGMTEKASTAGRQNGDSNFTQISKRTPFISWIWVLVVLLGAIICARKMNQ
jgi:hypothetical protein